MWPSEVLEAKKRFAENNRRRTLIGEVQKVILSGRQWRDLRNDLQLVVDLSTEIFKQRGTRKAVGVRSAQSRKSLQAAFREAVIYIAKSQHATRLL